MPELKLQCDYSRKKKRKFFNDKEPKEYHGFLVEPENIPDEYKDKRQGPYWIWILDDLVKGVGIDFGNPNGTITEYKFIINLGGEKVAKFNTNSQNWMVLKTKEYFENTVKKIGFWGNDNYFYEVDKKEKSPSPKPSHPTPNSTSNQNIWVKVGLIFLPFLFLAFLLLIIKRMSKRKVRK